MTIPLSVVNDFGLWADAALTSAASTDAQAFNFNLYDGGASWDVELVGAADFDETNPDWACDPLFSYPELCFLPKLRIGVEWEKGLATALELVTTYLRSGRCREVLRSSLGVAVGFVDGELTIVWPEDAA